MAIQKQAGNYWMTRMIRVDPEIFQVTAVMDLYTNAASFQNGDNPVSSIQFTFPAGVFTNAAIQNIRDSVEAKTVLQPQFSGGVVVS